MFTQNDLVNLLTQLQGKDASRAPKDFRYVLYVRKSTDDKERQICSLPDQIKECQKLAKAKGIILKAEDIISEKQSAKEPDIRPKFRQMINDLKTGKYDGVIAWHPDRLARNMKEAGEIIDLIDKDIIKDMQFASFSFMNTASGKMLLGFQFVMSKEYSDKLSDDVKRGNRNKTEDGRYVGDFKHGYYKDKNQNLRPDGVNYDLILKAWQKRKQSETLDSIAEYLNENGYQIAKKIGGTEHKIYKMDKGELSKLFKDPVSAGVLVYGKEPPVNLVDKDPDFLPMITVDEFFQINKTDAKLQKLRSRIKGVGVGTIRADFLRGMVFCAECGKSMSTGITSKKNKKTDKTTHYFYYRCETAGCKSQDKSLRAKVIQEFVIDFLEKHRFESEKVYEHYKKEMALTIRENAKELESEFMSLIKRESAANNDLEYTRDYLKTATDPELKEDFEEDYKKIKDKLKTIAGEKEKINQAKELNKKAILTYSEFLELIDSLPDIIRKTKDLKQLDFYIKKIFSNFTVHEKIISKFELNSPFKEFSENGLLSMVGDARLELTTFRSQTGRSTN